MSISTSSHRITLTYSVCLLGECRKRGTRARVKQATALTWAFHWSGDASCICHRFGTLYVSNRFIFQGTLRSLESAQKYFSTQSRIEGWPLINRQSVSNREEAAVILSLMFLPLGFAGVTMQWYPQTEAEAANCILCIHDLMLHLEPQQFPRFFGSFPHTHMPATPVIKTSVLDVLLLLYFFVRTELYSIQLKEFASLISAVSVWHTSFWHKAFRLGPNGLGLEMRSSKDRPIRQSLMAANRRRILSGTILYKVYGYIYNIDR